MPRLVTTPCPASVLHVPTSSHPAACPWASAGHPSVSPGPSVADPSAFFPVHIPLTFTSPCSNSVHSPSCQHSFHNKPNSLDLPSFQFPTRQSFITVHPALLVLGPQAAAESWQQQRSQHRFQSLQINVHHAVTARQSSRVSPMSTFPHSSLSGISILCSLLISHVHFLSSLTPSRWPCLLIQREQLVTR